MAAAKRRKGKGGGPGMFSPKLSLREVVYFASTMARYADRGYKLQRAIESLSKSSQRNVRRAAGMVGQYIREGFQPDEAFERTGMFPQEFVSVVRAAKGMTNSELYLQLASTLEHAADLRSQLFGLVKMPIIYIVMLCAMAAVLTVMVLPVFVGDIDKAQGVAWLLMKTRQTIQDASWISIGIVVAVVSGAFGIALTNSDFRRMTERLLIHMPLVGELFWLMDVARASGYLGLLLKTDKTAKGPFDMTAEAVGMLITKDALAEWRNLVISGYQMGDAFEEVKSQWPADMRDVVEAGVASGALPQELATYSQILRGEVLDRIKLIRPTMDFISLLIASLGIGVLIYYCFFVPMLDRFNAVL